MVRPARTAGRTTSGAGDGRAYPSGAQLLAVVWAPWRRQFTAFGRFALVPVVIDEADHDELFNRMRTAELPSPTHGAAEEYQAPLTSVFVLAAFATGASLSALIASPPRSGGVSAASPGGVRSASCCTKMPSALASGSHGQSGHRSVMW